MPLRGHGHGILPCPCNVSESVTILRLRPGSDGVHCQFFFEVARHHDALQGDIRIPLVQPAENCDLSLSTCGFLSESVCESCPENSFSRPCDKRGAAFKLCHGAYVTASAHTIMYVCIFVYRGRGNVYMGAGPDSGHGPATVPVGEAGHWALWGRVAQWAVDTDPIISSLRAVPFLGIFLKSFQILGASLCI